MRSLVPPAAVLALACAAASPDAQAASGSIDSFSASALTVQAGATVDFFVSYSVATSTWLDGSSDPHEPAPQEGYQEWTLNWYSYDRERLTGVWLQAGGENFAEFPSVPEGASHGGGWSFSLTFPDVGQFSVGVSGGWEVEASIGYGAENASRNCYRADPEYDASLSCDWWTYSYPQTDDYETRGGSFVPAALSIEVLAAVPEPQTWALWLVGAAALAARRLVTRR